MGGSLIFRKESCYLVVSAAGSRSRATNLSLPPKQPLPRAGTGHHLPTAAAGLGLHRQEGDTGDMGEPSLSAERSEGSEAAPGV